MEAPIAVDNDTMSKNTEIDELFQCPICFSLLYEPVTAACGHTCCKVCMVQWLRASSSPRCAAGCSTPLSRVMPGVNVLLKSRLQAQFPKQTAARKIELERLALGDKGLADALKFMRPGGDRGSRAVGAHAIDLPPHQHAITIHREEGAGRNTVRISVPAAPPTINWADLRVILQRSAGPKFLCAFVLTVLCLLVGSAVDFGKPNVITDMDAILREDRTLQKPVIEWTTTDVAAWLHNKRSLAGSGMKIDGLDIDGKLLLRLDEQDFLEVMTIQNSIQRKALKLAVEELRSRDRFLSVDFWDYWKENRYQAQVLTTGVHALPRMTGLYLHVMDPSVIKAFITTPQPTLLFQLTYCLAPHLVAAWHAGMFFSTQPFVSLLYMMMLNTAFVGEVSLLVECIKARSALAFVRATQTACLWVSLVLVLFPLTPWFLCDFLFSVSMTVPVLLPLLGYAITAYTHVRGVFGGRVLTT